MDIIVNGTSYTVDESKFSPETQAALIEQGVKIIAQRANAGEENKDKFETNIRERLAALEANTYRFGAGGGGGPRLSPEEVYWREGAAIMAKSKMAMTAKDAEKYVKQDRAVVIAGISEAAKVGKKTVTEKLEAYVAKRLGETADLL